MWDAWPRFKREVAWILDYKIKLINSEIDKSDAISLKVLFNRMEHWEAGAIFTTNECQLHKTA